MAGNVDGVIDAILVLDCQAGSLAALDQLVARWQKRLWQHAYYQTGDTNAAWDVSQESWLGIVRGIARLEDASKFKSWAFQIVTNKSNNWLRSRHQAPRCGDRVNEIEAKSEDSRQRETIDEIHLILRRLAPQ